MQIAARNDLRESGASRATRRGWWVLYAAVCVLGVGAAYAPTLVSGFARMQAERSDTLFFNYVLEHQLVQLTSPEAIGTFWSPAFFHPAPGALAYSESMIGTLPLYAALRVLLAPTTAYQVWAMVLLVADCLAMIWLLRRLGVRPLLAAVGGFVFAFGLPRVGHLYQQHLFPQPWTPVAFAALIGFLRQPRWRDWLLLLAAVAAQLLSSLHLGWFLGFGLTIWTIVWLAVDVRAAARVWSWSRQRGRWAGVLASAALAGLLVVAVLGPYLDATRTRGVRDDGQVTIFGPRLQSWLAAPRASIHRTLGTLSTLGNLAPALDRDAAPFYYEHELFPGVFSIAIGALAFATSWRRRTHRRAAVACSAIGAAALLIALSLYVPREVAPDTPIRARGWSAWWTVLDLVPGARSMRAHNRIWTIVHPLLLVGALAGLEELLRRKPLRRPYPVALAGLCVFAVAEQLVLVQPSFDKRLLLDEIDRMRRAIPAGCAVVYFPLVANEPYSVGQVRAMWAALQANVATVNGYSSYFPPGMPSAERTASREEIARWLATTQDARAFCYVDAW